MICEKFPFFSMKDAKRWPENQLFLGCFEIEDKFLLNGVLL